MSAPEHQKFTELDTSQVARNLRHMDDASVAELVSGELRAQVFEEILRRVPGHVDPQRAAGVDTLVRFEVTGAGTAQEADSFDARFHDGRCEVSREPLGTPEVTLTLNAVDFLRMVTGGVSGTQLYSDGRLHIRGDLALAGSLPSLFTIPG